jgi:hypothetical protein
MKLSKVLKRAKTGVQYDTILRNATGAKKSPNIGRLTALVERPKT